ncbi:MAG: O-antigen ligase family protein [Candidatus Kaiserbacteria bacterium]|nr:O-antigen ligase family protein [Candidatus Kaiserbacteria bacterium]
MQSGGTAKSIARWAALAALFLLPIAPLIVANDFFFPFITGKAFYLRILIEIAVSAWVVLALLDKEYRPRFSWIGAVVVGFVIWMFVADIFAINSAKAFWSNFERMEGWVLLIHLLGLFFAASAVLRVEKKWRAWFLTSLGVSVVIVGYALLQLSGTLAIHQGAGRIDATLGNSAYLAIYFLFNVFIALWLALTEKYSWLKWSLVALAALEAVLIFFTETRGTIIGLTLALALAALLTACTASKRIRFGAASAFALILILVGGFYLARNSSFIQNNHVLQRVATISLADGQTRLTVWRMAFKGVLERPLTGWGQEGFNYVFNKYYDPSLYEQEQWFDRAHNAFIDWFSAGGVPAFLLYLSLFGSALVLLWRSSQLSRPERIALTAALVGYAVHNLFVFDNLYSYIYFFAILALIDSQVARPMERLERASVFSAEDGTTFALPIAAVVAFALIWFVNIPGMQAAAKLITAMSPSADGIKGNIAAFEDVTAHPAFAAQEIREQTVSFAANVIKSQSATNAEKQQAISLAIAEMQKQVTAYPLDAREHLQLSYAYRVAGDSGNALKEIQAALLLSPKKVEFWIEAGVLEWDLGNAKAAQTDFNTAYTLGGKQFPVLSVYAAAGYIAAGDQSTANKILLDAYGTTNIDSEVLTVAYYRAKDWPQLIAVWKSRVARPDATVETWFGLASAYYMAGDAAHAIATIHTAVAKYPEAASSGDAAIKQIEGGK